MKKIFTLICMAFVAMSVNAQEVFDISSFLVQHEYDAQDAEGNNIKVIKYDAFADGKVTAVDNASPNNKGAGTKEEPLAKGTTDAEAFAQATAVTLTDYTVVAATENCQLTLVSTPNANDNSAATAWTISDQTGQNGALSTEACQPKFNVYVSGKGNPTSTYFGYWVKNDAGDASFKAPNDYNTFWTPEVAAAPSKGAYTLIKVTKAGTVRIGVRIPKAGKNRKVYFVKQSDGSILPQDKYYAEGYDNNNTNEYIKHTTTDYVVATDVNNQFIGYIDVELPANETYVMFSPDTQIGIYGFYFAASDPAGISTVKASQNADAPIYNLAGQKVSKDYKGVKVQNGKKFLK